jgi:hypothetical protein
MNKPEYYALTEASEMLNCSRDGLIHFGASGKLPLYVLGSRYRVEAVEIDRLNKTERKFVVAGRESKILKLSRYCLLELESGDNQAEVVIEPEPIYEYTNTNPKSPIFKEYEPGQWRRQIGEIRYFLEYENTVNPLDIFSTKDLLDMEKRGFNTDTLFSPVRLNECVMVVLAKDLDILKEPTEGRRKRNPMQRDTSDSLHLIDNLLNHYGIRYFDELSGQEAWARIISGGYKDHEITVTPGISQKSIVVNGKQILKGDFLEQYRKRFDPKKLQ